MRNHRQDWQARRTHCFREWAKRSKAESGLFGRDAASTFAACCSRSCKASRCSLFIYRRLACEFRHRVAPFVP